MFGRTQRWIDQQSFTVQLMVFIAIFFVVRTFFFGLYQVPTGSMETTMLKGERFLADKCTVWFSPIKRGTIISFNDPNYPYSENTFMRLWQYYVGMPQGLNVLNWQPINLTKRVIGIPGDHVVGKIEGGKPVIYLNDEKLDEPYVNRYPLISLWGCGGINSIDRVSYDPSLPYDQQQFYKINPADIVRLPQVQTIIQPATPIPQDTFDVTLGPDEYWVMGDSRLNSSDSRMWGTLRGDLIHGKIVFRIASVDSDSTWWIIDLIKNPFEFFARSRWNRWFNLVG